MTPFNLEAAKRGEPLITRDYDEITFIAHVPESSSKLSRVVVLSKMYPRKVYCISEDGRFEGDAKYDVFMEKKTRQAWAFVSPTGSLSSLSKESISKEEGERIHNAKFTEIEVPV